jgi:MFS family permease
VTASQEAPRRTRLGVVAAVCALALAILCTTLPTPLNVLHRDRFGLSELMITVISATYGAAALTSLVLFGRLSGKIGPPALALEGLALSALGVATFLISDRPAFLITGHLLSGLSAGISVGAVVATLAPTFSIPLCAAISMLLIGEGVLGEAMTLRPALLTSATAVAVLAAGVALLIARPHATGQRVNGGVDARTPMQPVMRPVSRRAVHLHRVGTGPAPRTAKGRARSLQCRPPLRPQN